MITAFELLLVIGFLLWIVGLTMSLVFGVVREVSMTLLYGGLSAMLISLGAISVLAVLP